MTEETVSKRGRPVGTRTATVELDTLSFKVPVELKARLQAYAKQRRHSISELIREGVEWRIGEAGDPLNLRYGTVTSSETAYEGNTGNTDILGANLEALHGMLSTVMAEVRQLHGSVQALEQRIGSAEGVQASSVTGNTGIAFVDGDIPAASMRAQMGETGRVQAPSVPPIAVTPMVKVDKEEVIVRIQQMRDRGLDSTQIARALQAEGVPTLSAEAQLQAVVEMLEHRAVQDGSEGETSNTENAPGEHGVVQRSVKGNTSITSVDGDIPAASMEAQSTLAQTLAAEDTREGIPPYDPAKRVLGKLCPRGHDYHGTGQSLRKNNRSRTCCACDAEQKRERRQAKRQEVSA